MDTHERLRQLLNERGWTEYRLAKNCGLSESTIANIYRRNTVPSLATLEAICKGFGITMAQFFAPRVRWSKSTQNSKSCLKTGSTSHRNKRKRRTRC